MKSARENHLWERIFVGKDEISGDESSLEWIFIRRDEISEDESSLEEDFFPQG